MDQLKKQVAKARRRLVLEQFLRICSWTLLICLLAAGIGLAIWRVAGPAPWRDAWLGWLFGGLAAGLVSAVAITFFARRGALDAAVEMDRRFGLKERVSSSLALGPEELDSEVGKALVADAVRRVERVDVAEKFRVRTSWGAGLRLASAGAFFAALLVPVASPDKEAEAAAKAEREQLQTTTESMRKKLERQKRELLEKGLTDASDLLQKVDEDLADLNKSEASRKEALIRINDLAQEIAERRKQLGDGAEVKKQLKRLQDMESGPADKMMSALQDGDLGGAANEMKKLKDNLNQGEMSDSQRAQLAKQLGQMQRKLDQMRADQEQAKQNLRNQIEQRKAAGDMETASKLQQKLEALEQMNSQMDKLGKMSQKLGEAAEALESADMDLATQSLDEMLDQLGQLQSDLETAEALDAMLDQLADGKSSMNCPNCGGAGCASCQSSRPGRGLGEGRGKGDRPEEETDKGFFNSKVPAHLQKGSAVKMGIADGPNRAGISREQAREAILSSVNNQESVVNQQRRLPRDQREHVGEYFERIKK